LKEAQSKHYRCVLGEKKDRVKPNELKYLQAISSRRHGVWIGFCKGDKTHHEHIFVLKKTQKWNLLHTISDSFKKPDGKVLGTRLFERLSKMRCPVGQAYMILQRKATRELNMENVDIYKCKGNFQGKGHKEHLVRIHHGELEVEINKKSVGVVIVTIESD